MAKPTELTDDVRSYIRSVSRALARGDVHLADELEQETCLAALKDGPREPRALHAWLRAVARNCLRSRRAKVATRPRMESIGARTFEGRSEDPAECVATEEIREALRGHLGSLPRRYSSVVSLRLMEGLPPREIASRLDMPVETVRTRVRRGVERLRDDVERSVGGEEALRPHRPLLGFMAFIPRRLRNTAAVAAPAVAVLGIVHVAGETSVDPGFTDTRVAAAPADTGGAAMLPSPGDIGLARGEALAELVSPEEPQAAAVELSDNERLLRQLEGAKRFDVRVVDATGNPVPGAEIFFRRGLNGHTWRAAETEDDGTAEVVAIPRLRWIAARGSEGQVSIARLIEQPQLLTGAALELALRPVDVDWVEIDGATETAKARLAAIDAVSNQCSMDSSLGIVGPAVWLPAWRDEAGRFGFADHGLASRIEVMDRGSLAFRSPVFRTNLPRKLTIVPGWTATGRAMDAGGRPLSERLLSVYESAASGGPELFSVRTDAAGHFKTPRIFCGGITVALASGSMSFGFDRSGTTQGAEAVHPLGELVFEDQPVGQPIYLEGQIVGPTEGLRLTAIRFTEASLSLAHRAQLKHHRSAPVFLADDGSFVVPRAPAEIGALVVEIDGSGAPPHLVPRPPGGWEPTGTRIDPGAPLGASLRVPLRAVERPATLFFAEAQTGFLRVEEIGPSSVDGFVEVHRLPPGEYELMAQTAAGRTVVRPGIKLEAGNIHSLSPLDQDFGRARIQWDPIQAAGAPDESVHVTVTGQAPGGMAPPVGRIEPTPLRFRCERGALHLELSEIELVSGEHHLEIRGPKDLWTSVIKVDAGQLVDVTPIAAGDRPR